MTSFPESESESTDQADEPVSFFPASNGQALEWLAVLGSANIEAYLHRNPEGDWQIDVPLHRAAEAEAQLRLFVTENKHWPPAWSLPKETEVPFSVTSMVVAVCLLAFFVYTGPYDDRTIWFERGAAHAKYIMEGEWWRTITALTMHSDFPHVSGNMIGIVLLGIGVCARLGPGIGWLSIMVSGIIGNIATAYLWQQGRVSVGASTSVFGAIGLLAGLSIAEHIRLGGGFSFKGWGVPTILVLAALSLMGISPDADVTAHLAGALAGLAMGIPLGWMESRQRLVWLQVLAGLSAVSVLAAAWIIALHPPS